MLGAQLPSLEMTVEKVEDIYIALPQMTGALHMKKIVLQKKICTADFRYLCYLLLDKFYYTSEDMIIDQPSFWIKKGVLCK